MTFDVVVVSMSLKIMSGLFLGFLGVGVHHHSVTFNFGSAKVCSPAIFETCFSYDKTILIVATDYYMYFYIIVLFPLTAILHLINFTA